MVAPAKVVTIFDGSTGVRESVTILLLAEADRLYVAYRTSLPLSHDLSTRSGTGAATGRSSVRGKG